MSEVSTAGSGEHSAHSPSDAPTVPGVPTPRQPAPGGARSRSTLFLLLVLAVIAIATSLAWQTRLTDILARNPPPGEAWGSCGFGGSSPELVEQSCVRLCSPLAWSPDGRLLASPARPGIAIWDVSSGHLLRRLNSQDVSFLAFSPDGASLAVAGSGGTISFWDLATERRRFSVETRSTSPWSLAWHPSGTKVAVVDESEGATIWDTRTGACVKSLPVFPMKFCRALAFSPDGRLLAAGTQSGLVAWDWQEGRRLSDGGIHEMVTQVQFSPDGRFLAVDDLALDVTRRKFASTSVRLLETSSFTQVKTFPGVFPCFAFKGRKHAIVLADAQGRVWEHETPTSEPSRLLPKVTGVDMFWVDPMGTTLISGQENQYPTVATGVYHLATGEASPGFHAPQDDLWDLQVLDSKSLVVRTPHSVVVLPLVPQVPHWRIPSTAYSAESEWPLYASTRTVSDGRYLAFSDGAALHVLDQETRRSVGVLPAGKRRTFHDFQWIPGRHALLVIEVPEPRARFPGPSTVVQWEPLAQETTLLASADSVPLIRARAASMVTRREGAGYQVVDAGSGDLVASVGKPDFFRPAGQFPVACSRSRLEVRDLRTALPVATLQGRDVSLMEISSSKDGLLLAASDRHATRVWDLGPLASPRPGESSSRGVGSALTASPRSSVPPAAAPNAPASGTLPTISPLAVLNTGDECSPSEGPDTVDLSTVSQCFSPDGRTLLVRRDQGAFQVWDVATGKRLGVLSLQYSGTRWFFLATDGRYDGSDDILTSIDVRVQGKVYPLTRFDRDYYSPGLLSSLFEGQRPPMPPKLRHLPCPAPTPTSPGPTPSRPRASPFRP